MVDWRVRFHKTRFITQGDLKKCCQLRGLSAEACYEGGWKEPKRELNIRYDQQFNFKSSKGTTDVLMFSTKMCSISTSKNFLSGMKLHSRTEKVAWNTEQNWSQRCFTAKRAKKCCFCPWWPWPSNLSKQGTKHIFHVNLVQIRSAVPKIFHTQTKEVTDSTKNRALHSSLCAVITAAAQHAVVIITRG